MNDLLKAVQLFLDALEDNDHHLNDAVYDALGELRQAVEQAKGVEADKRIVELERLVKAQQKAFDIESNRITFAEHKSYHKMLICDAIKKMKECQGRPYSAWDMWLIDAKCGLERVLREWPAPQEVTLATPPSVDALIAEAVAKEREACAKLLEHSADSVSVVGEFAVLDMAKAIRARSGQC